MPSRPSWRRLALVLVTCATLATLTGCPRSAPQVVLYCSQDREFADTILDAFRQLTGLGVAPKFDSEAAKSVALYEEIVADRNRPRCDVFWNNEILNTIRLQRQGLLEPYDSPSAIPYPGQWKAKDHTWHAFAGRARVLIVNTRLVKEKDRPRSLLDLTHERWRGRVVMAKPNHGTSATQAACLFEVLGKDEAQQFYRGLKANEVRIAPGNKDVAVWVGEGRTKLGQEVAVGITDTDDALAEARAGRDVAIIFPDSKAGPHPRMGTLVLPNTVAIIKGCPNLAGAKRLVDYLLSADVEAKLAEGDSGQLPLSLAVEAKLPPELEGLRTVLAMAVDWERAADLQGEAQAFLTKEFAAP
jgi:iron(III) transport system substrate-binding protein